MTLQRKTVAVVGGGAAGFFGAIACAAANSDCRVIILERAKQLLSKVRISGGGRCNVTHACFDPALLVHNYPRGHKELRGAFSRFQPRDTVSWFESRGVALKAEEDGRMFPVTDSSETIINCLLDQAHKYGVDIRTERGVVDCERRDQHYLLTLSNGDTLTCDRLLVASGHAPKVTMWLQKLGHTLTPPVPSLFTFNVPNSPLHALAGISVPRVKVTLETCNLQQTGPLLITHWGFSGPAVLKLSAWGARHLFDQLYKCPLEINWLPDISTESLKQLLTNYRTVHPTRLVSGDSPVPLPKNLWKALVEHAGASKELRWNALPKLLTQHIIDALHRSRFLIDGKTTYKDEFVTCGGVKLQEVDFKTMQSRLSPGLYFAGEVLDIDGVTGGFNFQNAWTTSWIAGNAMGAMSQ